MLKDKVAIVTGAGSGIGQATALRFAQEGATVVAADVNAEAAQATADKINAAGGKAMAIALNVADKAAVDAAFAQVVDAYGRVDILINNAGINRDAMSKKMSEEQWDAVLNVNLKGTWLCAQAAGRLMTQQKYGRIVNTASIAVRGNIGQANYAASKAGLSGLSKSLAREVGARGITVNVVAPGFIDTDMTRALGDDKRGALAAAIPLQRLGAVEDVAHAVVFLAAPAGSYITGETLHVNGGMYMI